MATVDFISVYDTQFAGGAKGDWNGTTGTDDTAAFQAAINYARANKVRRIIVGFAHKITDLNLTNSHYSGIIFEGISAENDLQGNNISTVVVSGSTSQGFDISGSDGLQFKSINFIGDKNAPPVSAIFSSRTTLSQESYGHIFDNCLIGGSFNSGGAGIYNFAGEGWSFPNGRMMIDSGHGLYFTAKNSLGKRSKFASTRATASFSGTTMTVSGLVGGQILPGMLISGSGVAANTRVVSGPGGNGSYVVSVSQTLGSVTIHIDSAFRYLTFSEFDNFDFRHHDSSGKNAIWFEGNYTSGALETYSTIENIDFRHCYFSSVGTTGKAGFCIRLTDVSGGVCIDGCRDETFTNINPNASDGFMQIDSSGNNSQLIGLTFKGGNVFVTQRWIVKGGRIQNLNISGQKVYSASSSAATIAGWPYPGLDKHATWQFEVVDGADGRISPNENFVVTGDAYLLRVMPGDRNTALNNFLLPSGTINHVFDRQFHGNPYGVLNAEIRGEMCFDDYYRRMYLSVGITAGADAYAWQDLGYKEYAVANANPATDTNKNGYSYSANQLVWNSQPVVAGAIGWVCITAGTAGTLTGVNANASTGSPIVSITTNNAVAKLKQGQWLNFGGWYSAQIKSVDSNNQITLLSNAGSGFTSGAISFLTPLFKSWGNINTSGATAYLPNPATAGLGARAIVTDATSTTFMSIVAGGGSNVVPVFCDGANWKIG